MRSEPMRAMTESVSPIASPKVVSPSTVKVEALVVAKVTPPEAVKEFEKTSPSASTKNFTAPFTAIPMRFESAVAELGFI